MKKFLLTAFFILAPLALTGWGQVADTWHGMLQVSPYHSLPLVLHISEGVEGYTATLDSPDQGATGIPVNKITFDTDSLILRFESTIINAAYQGTLEGDTIRGIFTQNGYFVKLNLARGEYRAEVTEEIPYLAEEVTIRSSEVVLAGTLTKPKEEGNTALLLVAGSGPNNRDSQIAQHKPLYFIADHLTRQGFTVLRYDKRGVGQSTGQFSQSMLADFATDASSAFSYLKSLGYERVGIIGHSEGGLIAQMIASERTKEVDFIILLAAPGVTGLETIVFQNKVMMAHLLKPEKVEEFAQVTEDTFKDITYVSDSRVQDSLLIAVYFEKVMPMVREEQRASTAQMVNSERYFQSMLNAISSPYYKDFLQFDPKRYLPHISCPILALNGTKDMQVEAMRSLEAIKSLATASPSVTIRPLEGLNHLFIKSETGLPLEYLQLSASFSEDALSEIASWIATLPTSVIP